MTVFIQKGDAPMSRRQAEKRGTRYFEAQKKQFERKQGLLENDPDYTAWAQQWVADNQVNAAHNLFNHQLANYRAAAARLARYRLAEGRAEITEQRETGEFDPETGAPITETVVTAPAVDPLPATIEQPVYDPETGAQTGTETVPNPEIVADDAERAAAQAVIDGTPQEVKDFAGEVQPG